MKIKEILNPKNWVEMIRTFIKSFPSILHTIHLFSTFFIILLIFLFEKIVSLIERVPLIGKLFKFINEKTADFRKATVNRLESTRPSEVKRIYLINLAYRNMMIKRTRSLITIFGMSVGVGAIVLLLSLGYGVERLIISKVAGLNELKMIDISAGENTALRLNQDVFNTINKLKEKSEVIPIISIVGRINFNKATTDVLAYAVPSNYLINGINTKFIKGRPFANNVSLDQKISLNILENGQVAGTETKIEQGQLGQKISNQKVLFNLNPEKAIIIWGGCSISSKLIGYSTRIDGDSAVISIGEGTITLFPKMDGQDMINIIIFIWGNG